MDDYAKLQLAAIRDKCRDVLEDLEALVGPPAHCQGPLMQRVLTYLAARPEGARGVEIKRAVGVLGGSLHPLLTQLLRRELVTRYARGVYATTERGLEAAKLPPDAVDTLDARRGASDNATLEVDADGIMT